MHQSPLIKPAGTDVMMDEDIVHAVQGCRKYLPGMEVGSGVRSWVRDGERDMILS